MRCERFGWFVRQLPIAALAAALCLPAVLANAQTGSSGSSNQGNQGNREGGTQQRQEQPDRDRSTERDRDFRDDEQTRERSQEQAQERTNQQNLRTRSQSSEDDRQYQSQPSRSQPRDDFDRSDRSQYSEDRRYQQDREGYGQSGRSGQQLQLGASFSQEDDTLTVNRVQQGSFASEAGLRQGDEIISLNGREIYSQSEINRWLASSPQQQGTLIVRRNGERRTLYLDPESFGQLSRRSGQPGMRSLGISLNTRGENLIVSELQSRSMAYNAGFREGDVIVSVNGRRVWDQDDFHRVLWLNPNQRATVIVRRDGRQYSVYLTPQQDQTASESGQYSQRRGRAELGVVLDPRYYDVAIVQQVYPDSPAEAAGLRRNDTIVSVNGQAIRSPQDLVNLIDRMRPGEEVEIQFTRRQSMRAPVTLGASGSSAQFSERRQYDERTTRTFDRNDSDF